MSASKVSLEDGLPGKCGRRRSSAISAACAAAKRRIERCRSGLETGGGPSPDAYVAGVSPVPVQMWTGVPESLVSGAEVARQRRRDRRLSAARWHTPPTPSAASAAARALRQNSSGEWRRQAAAEADGQDGASMTTAEGCEIGMRRRDECCGSDWGYGAAACPLASSALQTEYRTVLHRTTQQCH